MVGCLCIHGFTGGPYEVQPLVDYLTQETNWEIVTPVLPGHGEQLSLTGVSYTKWIDCVEEELKKLLDKFDTLYLIGFSMGGVIASYLAAKYPISKLVLLSAAVYYTNPKQLISDVHDLFKLGLQGKIHENELYERYKKKIIATPLSAIIQFQQLVRMVRPVLEKISVPTLIVQGKCDGIVPMKSAEYIHQTISSARKKLIYIESAKHHVCYCDERKELFAEVYTFLKE
ncbi:alpha/beta hydrolase [Cytobacillus sp. IB215316]|uniref:alpha/beta hydrolase n=1 Tax=Cytobacillus sp. IB215316 TaxID=3097354 RepID=UPI002A0B5610|nr:alpha/beta fold hydrolase [Cytobacillus sp. IB215316]MDX8362826.1 alpha/beta fold hydrolase [Cytobacillus sp. IB215316]